MSRSWLPIARQVSSPDLTPSPARRRSAGRIALVVLLLALTIAVAAPTAPSAQAATGDPILVIGDSLCLGARDYGGDLTGVLRAAGWEASYACSGGQWLSWGIAQVQARATVPATVIVELGTNGGGQEAGFTTRLDTMRRELVARGADQVIWVDYADRAGTYGPKLAQLQSFAGSHGDRVVRWSDRIVGHPEWFRPDGIHYELAGLVAYSAAIAEVAAAASSDGPGAALALDRLYLGFFGRLSDDEGRATWTGLLDRGWSLPTVGDRFAESAEFRDRYGSLDDGQFVDLVYHNVLGRPADPGGRAGWLTHLRSGRTRGWVMTGFTESMEFRVASVDRIDAVRRPQVQRLYLAFFGRMPDPTGMGGWLGALNHGTPLSEVAGHFAASAEFRARYGTLSNAEFVDLVYRNVLGREPDPEGRAWWNLVLSSGWSRGQVMERFSESPEFVWLTRAQTG